MSWGTGKGAEGEFGPSSSCFSSSSPDLLHYDDLPDWAKDNDKIRTGYRPVRACHRHCFDSLFYLHNETSNIYSHGLPFLLGWGSAFYSLFIHLPAIHASVVDTLAFLPLILGTMVCYFCSATFHLYLCHSPEQFSLWSKLDYVGIVAVLWGGFFTMTWFLFYESLKVKLAFIVCNLICCLATCFVILQDKFATPEYRTFRVLPFAFLFFTSFVPAYLAFTRPCPHPDAQAEVLELYLSCFSFLVLGSCLFALRIPERFVPHVFDFFGHSHCLFHILVVLGINCFHDACFKAFEYRRVL